MKSLSWLATTLPVTCLGAAVTKRASTLIPNSVLSSTSAFESYFGYDYPWGTTHNGAARMFAAHSVVADNVLTETATYTGDSDYAYHSGTVYAKQHFAVAAGGGLDFSADFVAPTVKGTWPAFWLTAVQGWPPEIDIAEWKGDGKISFNTFNTSSHVAAKDVAYPGSGSWHTVKAELRDAGNGKDVRTTFYLDGAEQASQVGEGYIGKAFYLIIDLQMEGSSGSPGPKGNTTYQVRNLNVLSYN